MLQVQISLRSAARRFWFFNSLAVTDANFGYSDPTSGNAQVHDISYSRRIAYTRTIMIKVEYINYQD